jgi:hypothetical protein
MAKIPFLYQKLAHALDDYSREQNIKSECQRREVLALLARKLRIRNEERAEVLREFEHYGVLEQESRRRVSLRRR